MRPTALLLATHGMHAWAIWATSYHPTYTDRQAPGLRERLEVAVDEAAAALVQTLRAYPRYLDELAVEKNWLSISLDLIIEEGGRRVCHGALCMSQGTRDTQKGCLLCASPLSLPCLVCRPRLSELHSGCHGLVGFMEAPSPAAKRLSEEYVHARRPTTRRHITVHRCPPTPLGRSNSPRRRPQVWLHTCRSGGVFAGPASCGADGPLGTRPRGGAWPRRGGV